MHEKKWKTRKYHEKLHAQQKNISAAGKVDLSIHSFLIQFPWGLFCLSVIYLFLFCVKVFLCKCFSLSTLILFYFSSLLPVNDMEREEGSGKNVFSEMSSSPNLQTFPVENVSTEIFRGTLSSYPVSRWRNLCFSLSYIFNFGARGFSLVFRSACVVVMDVRLCIV